MEQNIEQSLAIIIDAAFKYAGVQILDNVNTVRAGFFKLVSESKRLQELETKQAK